MKIEKNSYRPPVAASTEHREGSQQLSESVNWSSLVTKDNFHFFSSEPVLEAQQSAFHMRKPFVFAVVSSFSRSRPRMYAIEELSTLKHDLAREIYLAKDDAEAGFGVFLQQQRATRMDCYYTAPGRQEIRFLSGFPALIQFDQLGGLVVALNNVGEEGSKPSIFADRALSSAFFSTNLFVRPDSQVASMLLDGLSEQEVKAGMSYALHKVSGRLPPLFVKYLLDQGGDPNPAFAADSVSVNPRHYHPLQHAVGAKNAAVVALLLERGAEPTFVRCNGKSLLEVAEIGGEIYRALIKFGAKTPVNEQRTVYQDLSAAESTAG